VLLRSFRHALAGAVYILRTQRNARIELAIGVVAVGLASWLGFTPIEWAVLALTITVVVGLEWINTALELAVTLASPQRHPTAKAAKDVSAAAVLVSAMGAVVVGLFLFGPRLVALFRP
jgi:diacylglycerol kinase